MATFGWARCTDNVADVLRRGAWYPIVEESADGSGDHLRGLPPVPPPPGLRRQARHDGVRAVRPHRTDRLVGDVL